MEMETYYKVFGKGRMPCHGGSGKWPEPGEWLESSGPLRLCEDGTLHLCRRQDLIYWLGAEIWIAEASGETIVGEDKIGCLRARLISRLDTWNDRTARLFAADCAEAALLAERVAGREPHPASFEAVAMARLYTAGLATAAQLSVARVAARAAVAEAREAEGAAKAAVAEAAAATTKAMALETRTAAVWAARAAKEDAATAAKAMALETRAAAVWAARAKAAWAARAEAATAAKACHQKQTEMLFDYLEGRR